MAVEVETGADSRLGKTRVEVDGAEPCLRRGSSGEPGVALLDVAAVEERVEDIEAEWAECGEFGAICKGGGRLRSPFPEDISTHSLCPGWIYLTRVQFKI